MSHRPRYTTRSFGTHVEDTRTPTKRTPYVLSSEMRGGMTGEDVLGGSVWSMADDEMGAAGAEEQIRETLGIHAAPRRYRAAAASKQSSARSWSVYQKRSAIRIWGTVRVRRGSRVQSWRECAAQRELLLRQRLQLHVLVVVPAPREELVVRARLADRAFLDEVSIARSRVSVRTRPAQITE